MRVLNLATIAISCATAVSALLTVKTPSGIIIPSSLLTYLDCQIGDIVCKKEKVESCNESDIIKICNSNDPDSLYDIFYDKDIDIGDLTPTKFCKIHTEVCGMIENYDPHLTIEYIYNIEKYLDCDDSDTMCIHGKNVSCGSVLKRCWGNYPNKACQKLGNVCNKLAEIDVIKEAVKEIL
ncbi:hypothetical protein BCR36DRAFT_334724 [Piromyces finnis]|uniref:Uncharacterized protein n=1 Tax=Piromyces finnis TaxID=1754191 RepID=A0A1Y1V257_9FUNG|nr:hypothetical protein BCR36DRAFT_334724 [Piromyces finnis]|eukprot:ORX44329.1 hypothetical protein BCR36DRAFT_334724 [Piromyces finnis]